MNDIQPDDTIQQAEQTVGESSFVSINEALMATLGELQKASNTNSFGLCNTYTLFVEQDNHYFCTSRQELMTQTDAGKICRNHAPI